VFDAFEIARVPRYAVDLSWVEGVPLLASAKRASVVARDKESMTMALARDASSANGFAEALLASSAKPMPVAFQPDPAADVNRPEHAVAHGQQHSRVYEPHRGFAAEASNRLARVRW
jgi:hypothetical protein